jgi:hypothetical protein
MHFFLIYKNMFEKLLGFGRMYENKIFFLRGIFLDLFLNFQNFLRKISKKTRYFNTGSVSYSVNIQPNIMQN